MNYSTLVRFLLIGTVSTLFYSVLGFDFVRPWDDAITLTSNPLITEPWSLELFGKFFGAEQAMRFKPLHWILLKSVYSIAGFNPTAYHAAGLGFHLVATILFFNLLCALFRRTFHEVESRWRVTIAGVGTFVWAAHPLRVEPVAWITGSSYTLATCFMLGSFIVHLQAIESPSGMRRNLRFATAWILSTGAFLTYPVALLFPILLFALEIGPLKVAPRVWWHWRNPEGRRWLARHVFFVLPSVGALAATVTTRFLNRGVFEAAPSLVGLGLGERVLAALATLGSFVTKFFAPVNLNANSSLMLLDKGWSPWALLAATSIVLGLFALRRLFIRGPHNFYWVAFGYAMFTLPCLGLTEFPVWPPDRYSYPSDLILVSVICGICLHYFGKSPSALVRMLVLLGIFGIFMVRLTVGLLPVWRNVDTLFTHFSQSRNFTDSVGQQAHIFMWWGRYHASEGSPAQQVNKYYGEASRVFRKGMIEALEVGNYDEAVLLARRQEAGMGIDSILRRERAYWLLRLGRWQEALADLERANAELPNDIRVQELLEQARNHTVRKRL